MALVRVIFHMLFHLSILSFDFTIFIMAIQQSPNIPIPVYDASKSYELFEQEIDLLELFTDVPLAKGAGAIALFLPDDVKSN